jgi:hypothetical protein
MTDLLPLGMLDRPMTTANGDFPMTPTPQHLEPNASERGFIALPALAAAYGGEIKVYESSAATGPHLWIKSVDEGGQAVALHVTAETAWRFAEQIVTAVRNHYQGDATPEGAAYMVTPT